MLSTGVFDKGTVIKCMQINDMVIKILEVKFNIILCRFRRLISSSSS
jgi:hypothetical protein